MGFSSLFNALSSFSENDSFLHIQVLRNLNIPDQDGRRLSVGREDFELPSLHGSRHAYRPFIFRMGSFAKLDRWSPFLIDVSQFDCNYRTKKTKEMVRPWQKLF